MLVQYAKHIQDLGCALNADQCVVQCLDRFWSISVVCRCHWVRGGGGLARHSIPHLTIETIRQTLGTPHLSQTDLNFNLLVTFDFSPHSGSEGWLGGIACHSPIWAWTIDRHWKACMEQHGIDSMELERLCRLCMYIYMYIYTDICTATWNRLCLFWMMARGAGLSLIYSSIEDNGSQWPLYIL